MKTKVKICGMTRADDIKKALDLGADYIGFNLYSKSPRFVQANEVEVLLDIVPPEKRVIVDVETPVERVKEYLKWDIAACQIHFSLNISMSTVAAWAETCGADRFWAAPKLPPKEDFPQILMEFTETLLLDAYSRDAYGGTGKAKTNWQLYLDCTTMYQHKNWMLAGGLSPDNLKDALEFTEAFLVDLNSGVETAPGVKDTAKMEKAFKVIAEFDSRSA